MFVVVHKLETIQLLRQFFGIGFLAACVLLRRSKMLKRITIGVILNQRLIGVAVGDRIECGH